MHKQGHWMGQQSIWRAFSPACQCFVLLHGSAGGCDSLNKTPRPEIHSVAITNSGLNLERDSFRDRSRCLYF